MNNGCSAERYETTGRDKNLTARKIYMHVLLAVKAVSALTSVNILMNPFYILPWSGYLFPGFKAHSSQTERGSAIRPAIETLQKVNRSCGRARMASVHRTASP